MQKQRRKQPRARKKTRILGDWKHSGSKYTHLIDSIICNRHGAKLSFDGDEGATIITDACGIEKTYTGMIEGIFTISTQLKDFSSLPFDEEFARFSREKGYVPYPFTIIKGVRKCPPGLTTKIILDQDNNLQYEYLSSHELDVFSLEDQSSNHKEKISSFRHRLSSALKNANGKGLICSYSGGFDSVFLSSVYGKQCKKFLHFDTSESKSPTHARFFIDGKEHLAKLEILDQNEPVSNKDIDKYFSSIDEPSCDKAGIAEYLIARKAKKYFWPLMNGQGADKIFCNGKEYFRENFASALGYPLKGIKPSNALFLRVYRYSSPHHQRFLDHYAPEEKLSERSRFIIEKLYHTYHSSIRNDAANKLGAISLMLEASLHGIEKIKTASKAQSKKYYLPFMGQEVIKIAFSIPSNEKIGFKIGKRILRNAYPEVENSGYNSGAFITRKLTARISHEKKYEEFYFHQWQKAFAKARNANKKVQI